MRKRVQFPSSLRNYNNNNNNRPMDAKNRFIQQVRLIVDGSIIPREHRNGSSTRQLSTVMVVRMCSLTQEESCEEERLNSEEPPGQILVPF